VLIIVAGIVVTLLGVLVAVVAYLSHARSRAGRRAQTIPVETSPKSSSAKVVDAHNDGAETVRDIETETVDVRSVETAAEEIFGASDTDAEQAAGHGHGPFEMDSQEQLARYRFGSFVVGTGNRSAYRVARAAAESPGLRFNPLFIYGGPGLGKTHLMCALANAVFDRNKRANVRYLTSQALTEHILDAYYSREVEEFERQYVETDVLLVDDIQLLAMSRSLQSVVARILGEMYEQGKQIVVSSDRRPEDLRGLAHEVTARFATGVIVEVDRPDAALRTKILRRKARLGDWPVADELLVYVAHSLNGDIRTLEGVAMKLVAMKSLQGVRLDKAVVDHVLQEVSADSAQTTSPWEDGWTPPRPAEVGTAAAPVAPKNHSGAWITEHASGAGQALPSVQEGIEPREDGAPRRVNPLVREFSRAERVARKLATPSEVASAVPEAIAASVIVLGTSSQLVMNTVEAMVGRGGHHMESPDGEPWAYMVHLDCRDPGWVLVGTASWDEQTELARVLASHQPPAVVVVLDGEHPEIADAKDLIASAPGDGGLAVIVLGDFLSDTLEPLQKMLRCLLAVPQQFPVVVQGVVDTPGSRKWVRLALESRPPAACSQGSEQPDADMGSH
jgi:chromosomal replication initiator protein DnaA